MGSLERVKDRCSPELFKRKNVVGIAIGNKIINKIDTKVPCITVLVRKKVSEKRLKEEDIIPYMVDGQLTDVIAVGEIKALGKKTSVDRKSKIRPLIGGISVGHPSITAGTLGCFVENKAGETCILSNYHVLHGKVGDPVIQQGSYDGGTVEDNKVGSIANFIPIVFSAPNKGCNVSSGVTRTLNFLSKLLKRNSRFAYKTLEWNRADAAIAKIEGTPWIPSILDIGPLDGFDDVNKKEVTYIEKSGRTSGYTRKNILYKDVTVKVQYGPEQEALFTDQIVTSGQSEGGDSGSAGIWENKLVALLFAGSKAVTIFSKIDYVKKGLGLVSVR